MLKDGKMGQEIKLIRKQFRITRQEEKQIKEMMRKQKVDSFSEFLRQNLLKKNYQDRIFESWFSLWQSQSLNRLVEMCMKFWLSQEKIIK